MSNFSHLNENNNPKMVNVSDKKITKRTAIAKATMFLGEEIISHLNNDDVKNKKETNMDIEQILAELKGLLVEKKFSEEAVANMTQTFAEAIKKKDAEYRDSMTKAEKEKEG